MRSPFLRPTSAFLICCALPASADAQQYPNRPVRVIAAQSAGSALDTIARIVANKLSETTGQQFVIDNRGGAAGTIGIELGARAAPDGYTLTAGASSSMIVSKFTYRSLPFDSFRDFDAVSMIVNADSVMVVNPAVPVKSVKDLIALARAQPGRLNMASAGVGSSSHLAGLMFTTLAVVDAVHVPYKGGGPMAAAVMGGEAQFAVSPAAAVVGQIRAGRLRGVAITGRTRSPLLPDLPTIAEAGVPGYEYSSWNGVFAPKGTPRAIRGSLHAAIQKVLAVPDVKEQYALQGTVPQGSESPEEFGRYFRADYERIVKLVKAAGIKPE
jgi:tripartite-type tricarboxylate transporter receptor subunit TctC